MKRTNISGRNLQIKNTLLKKRMKILHSQNHRMKQSIETLTLNEKRLRLIFNNSLNGFALHEIITDDSGKPIDYIVLQVNKAFEHLTGLKADAIVGKRITEVIPGIENEPFIEIYGKVALTNEPIRFEQYAVALNKYYDIIAYSPQPRQFVTMFIDITARKLAEEENKKQQLHLEELVKQRVAELDAFIYSVYHDLLSPLRNILAFTDLLNKANSTVFDAKSKNYITRIMYQIHKTNRFLNDMMMYYKLSNREIKIQPVDLTKLVSDIITDLEPISNNPTPEFTVHNPLPILQSYEAIIGLAMTNLLSNAQKFVKPDTVPKISIWAEENEQWVRLFVKDNGIGIDPEYLTKIFVPFEQLNSYEKFPGTGLGLAIVKKGIEKLGGTVGVESEPGVGSTFWIELPRVPNKAF